MGREPALQRQGGVHSWRWCSKVYSVQGEWPSASIARCALCKVNDPQVNTSSQMRNPVGERFTARVLKEGGVVLSCALFVVYVLFQEAQSVYSQIKAKWHSRTKTKKCGGHPAEWLPKKSYPLSLCSHLGLTSKVVKHCNSSPSLMRVTIPYPPTLSLCKTSPPGRGALPTGPAIMLQLLHGL